jgi:hypothetical protein
MKLTAHQIIDETVAYYQEFPRSLNGERKVANETGDILCLYNGPNGEKCAYARCCTPDSEFEEGKSATCQPKAKLLPQYEGHSLSFWSGIQALHDTNCYWDGNRLTEEGIKKVEYLKSHY